MLEKQKSTLVARIIMILTLQSMKSQDLHFFSSLSPDRLGPQLCPLTSQQKEPMHRKWCKERGSEREWICGAFIKS